MTVSERLDQIDEQYPNVFRMPKELQEEHLRLSTILVGQVWDARMKDHGSIHSHLAKGEKDGQ